VALMLMSSFYILPLPFSLCHHRLLSFHHFAFSFKPFLSLPVRVLPSLSLPYILLFNFFSPWLFCYIFSFLLCFHPCSIPGSSLIFLREMLGNPANTVKFAWV
jgi:hypothetical protein